MQIDDCEAEVFTGFWIGLAARALQRAADARLRPLGLALSHLPVLRALGGGAALSQKDLARAARVEQPSMAELLARMERAGLVQRRPDPEDGRATRTSLTRVARARLGRANAALIACETEAMAGLSAAEQATLRRLLQRVVANLET